MFLSRPALRPLRAVLPLFLSVALAGCANTRGTLLPVAGAVPGASQVDMLVTTTRLPASDPKELFSGARSPMLSLANITVSIPPEGSRQKGEVQWPRSTPGNPATDFVALRADIIDQSQAVA